MEASGNSTVQVVVLDSGTIINEIREMFDSLGYSSEKVSEGYFVIDVPHALHYEAVQNKLMELLNAGIIDYAEPCLSKKHGLE